MDRIVKEVAVATAVLNYDLIVGDANKKKSYNRVIIGAGATGSAAAGDFEYKIVVGTEEKARLRNTVTGLVDHPDYTHKMRVVVPANAEISCIVTDAPATNPVLIWVEIL